MDDYKKAQRGQHNYRTKSNKSGEKRAAFNKATEEEMEDQVSNRGEYAFATVQEGIVIRASLPEVQIDGTLSEKYQVENLRWQTYRLFFETLTTVQYIGGRGIDRAINKEAFAMFLDEMHEAFCKVPELREADFWRRDSWSKKSAKMYNLRMMVKKKIIDYVNVNHSEKIKWIA